MRRVVALTTGQQEIPFSLWVKRDTVSWIQDLSSLPSSVSFLATSACLSGSFLSPPSAFLPRIPPIIRAFDDAPGQIGADITRDHQEFLTPSPCERSVPGLGLIRFCFFPLLIAVVSKLSLQILKFCKYPRFTRPR